MRLHRGSGILSYSYYEDYGYKVILSLDQGIVDFYRNLIPKYIKVNRQRYDAHISVVRNETPKNLENWNKYNNQEMEFFYSSYICEGQVYYWLDAYSLQLEEVRLSLGLPIVTKYDLGVPEGFNKIFHITIANKKKLD